MISYVREDLQKMLFRRCAGEQISGSHELNMTTGFVNSRPAQQP